MNSNSSIKEQESPLESVKKALTRFSSIEQTKEQEIIEGLPPMQIRKRKSSMDFLIPYIGLDIGGTLAKVCIAFQKGSEIEFQHLEHLQITTHSEFDVYFEVFPSHDLEQLFEFIEEKHISNFTQKFYISGGGAHKYKEQIEKRLGVKVLQVQEIQSLSYGLKVLDQLLPNNSVYKFDKESRLNKYVEHKNWMFPLILVQIGSGVSILKVNSQDEFERVSGTSLGGNMFLGISNLITGIKDYDKVLDKASEGNNKNTDLFVKDIYKQIESVPEDIYGDALCVSFGRVAQMIREGKEINKNDLLKSALQMVAFNISQIAFLFARVHKINNIFFTGYFIKNHTDTIECIDHAISYFSKSQQQDKQAYFLKHDGFLGALGSFYVAVNEKKKKQNNLENDIAEVCLSKEQSDKKQPQE